MALSCLALTYDPCSCSPVVSSHPNDALFETGLQCLESQEANMSFVGPLFHDLCVAALYLTCYTLLVPQATPRLTRARVCQSAFNTKNHFTMCVKELLL